MFDARIHSRTETADMTVNPDSDYAPDAPLWVGLAIVVALAVCAVAVVIAF